MAATVSSVSSITDQGDGTLDLTITKPTGTVSGDLLVAVIGQNETNGTWTAPSGWTSLSTDDAGAILSAGVFYKAAGGSEPASYTWAKGTLGASQKIGRIFRVTGHNTSTPIDYTPTATVKTTADLSQVAPDETTTEANVLLIRGVIVDRNRMASSTAPSGLTDEGHADSSGTASLAVGIGCGWELQASSGSTGTKTWTTANTEEAISYTVGIRSAAAAGLTTILKGGSNIVLNSSGDIVGV